jgi:hypothetical protein
MMSKKKTTWEEDMRYFLDYVGPEAIGRLLSPEALAEAIESQPPTGQAQMIEALLARPQMIEALLARLDPATLEAQLQARRACSQG